MRKLLLASYRFRTGDEYYNQTQLIAINSKDKNSDLDDVHEAERVFKIWFERVYMMSTLKSLMIFPAITETTIYPLVPPMDGTTPLNLVFSYPAICSLNEKGITSIEQASQMTDDELLRLRGVGKMAIQRLRNIPIHN